jgi:hypothetical protein
VQYTREQELLRQTFLAEATELVAGLEKDPNILAAFLTGSAAWGKPNPDGDLDILLITGNNQGVFYRYLIPKFCRTPRRAEFGFIPLAVVMEKIGRAYGDPLSCSTIEQFKNGKILFQKEDRGDRIIRACRDVVPGKLLVGRNINMVSGLMGSLRQALELKQYRNVLLFSRKIMSLSARMLLLVRERLGVAKEKQEFRAVNRIFARTESGHYETVMAVNNVGREKSYLTLLKTMTLLGNILSGKAVSDRIVSYNGFQG